MLLAVLFASLAGSAVVRGEATSGPGCICTLEYEPFCNPETGVTYGNRCQAETCGGQDLSTLVPGECEEAPVEPGVCEEEPFVVGNCKASIPSFSFNPKTGKCEDFIYGGCGGTGNNFDDFLECSKTCAPKTLPQPDDCICPAVIDPVCDPLTKITYNNKCEASCEGVDTANLVPLACSDGGGEAEPCICTEEYTPFCNPDTGVTYGNECEAVTCSGEDLDTLVPGECSGDPDPGCICPLVYSPLCHPVTKITYSNGCDAECEGLNVDTLVPGECNPIEAPEPCICTKEFAPVCNPDTGVTYGNGCEAGCDGLTDEDVVDGPCPDEQPEVAECCTEAQPFCLCSGGPDSPGFCATAEVAAATSCLFAEGGTCCSADGTPAPTRPPPVGLPVDPPTTDPPVTPTPPIQPCCAADESCCGDGCIPTVDLPRALCPVNGLCGCTEDPAPPVTPTPPIQACCGADESCCGDGCVATVDLPRVRCPVNGLCGCSDAPEPVAESPETPKPPMGEDEEEEDAPAPERPIVPETSDGGCSGLLCQWLRYYQWRRDNEE